MSGADERRLKSLISVYHALKSLACNKDFVGEYNPCCA